jgi:outer membrane lipoprotein-sorting protein
MTMPFTRRTALLAIAASAITAPALAATTPPPALSEEDAALVTRAVAYLEGLPASKGRFVQTDPRGGVAHGTLYLQRPGKARFEYDPPSGLVMASDGRLVGILNRRLKTYEAYPLGMTPLSLFLARQIRLDKGVRVSRVIRVSDGFSVVASDAHKKTEGQLTLNFSEAPLALQGWTITDAQGQSTRVNLEGFSPAGPFNSSIFTLKDPRPPVQPHR